MKCYGLIHGLQLRFYAAALILAQLTSFVSAGHAGWEFPAKPNGRAEIAFVENGKTVFSLACGHNLVLSVRYPIKQWRGPARLSIGNSRTHVDIVGRIDAGDDKRDMFLAVWTGGPDPANLDRLMSILSSRLKLAIRAGRGQYSLPGVEAGALRKYKNSC
jgi:hypothetical protein